MSTKEIERIPVLDRLLNKEIKRKEAATLLGISVRQVGRVKKKYKAMEAQGLVHGNRGKPSNHKIPSQEVDRIMSIVSSKYYDFGPTLAWEKLDENGEQPFSVERLRQEMIVRGMHHAKKRKMSRVHSPRERRDMVGELVQVDGSPHDWFEGRAGIGRCTLLVFIDDASGQLLHLEFATSESTQSYFVAVQSYLLTHGKPLAWYVDKHGVFRVNNSLDGQASPTDTTSITQFGRAMQQLRIEIICANSPQAKGRVEKTNQTLQDRLVKELRLRGINDITTANQYLPEFVSKYNAKFAVVPKSPVNAHRPLSSNEQVCLGEILSEQAERTVSKAGTVRYHNLTLRLDVGRMAYKYRHAKVIVVEQGNGSVTIRYQGSLLPYTIIKQQPKVSQIASSKQVNVVVDGLRRIQERTLTSQETSKLSLFDQISHRNWEAYQGI
jgi:hypothetical protein